MIYLIRHAETLWNFQLRKQGLNDSPLTPTGEWQARTYGTVLRDLIPKEMVERAQVQLHSSPLGRARITTQHLIRALGIPDEQVRYDERLTEFDYGDWSGLTNEEIESRYPGALESRENDKWHYTVPNGESYEDVDRKVGRWMDELLHDRILVVVTHSVVSRVIRRRFLDLSRLEAGRWEHSQYLIFRLNGKAVEEIDIREYRPVPGHSHHRSGQDRTDL